MHTHTHSNTHTHQHTPSHTHTHTHTHRHSNGELKARYRFAAQTRRHLHWERTRYVRCLRSHAQQLRQGRRNHLEAGMCVCVSESVCIGDTHTHTHTHTHAHTHTHRWLDQWCSLGFHSLRCLHSSTRQWLQICKLLRMYRRHWTHKILYRYVIPGARLGNCIHWSSSGKI